MPYMIRGFGRMPFWHVNIFDIERSTYCIWISFYYYLSIYFFFIDVFFIFIYFVFGIISKLLVTFHMFQLCLLLQF